MKSEFQTICGSYEKVDDNPFGTMYSAQMKTLFTIGIIVGIFGLSGCGKDEQEYKYQYSYNGCDTGEHKFDSVDALCASLQSDSANRGCAESIREQSFKSQCPGTFVRRD